MSKPLFDNVGKEIKEIAEVIARRIMIRYFFIALIVAIAGIAIASGEGYPLIGIISVVIAIIIGVCGYDKSRWEVMEFYALGEIADRIISIDKKMKGKKPVPIPIDEKPDDVVENWTLKIKRKKDGSWECPFCDHKNPAGADWCEECGVQAEF